MRIESIVLTTFLMLSGCAASAISDAASRGDIVAVKRLLDQGVSDRAKNDALVEAAFAGSIPSVSLLLERGANANYINQSGDTPIAKAIFMLNEEVIKVLLAHGAKPDLRYRGGATPLASIGRGIADPPEKRLEAGVELLLTAGAKPWAIDGRGRSSFSELAEHPSVLAALCAHASKIPALRVGTPPRFVLAGSEDAVVLLGGQPGFTTSTAVKPGTLSAAATDPAGHPALREALDLLPEDPLPREEWWHATLFAYAPGKVRLGVSGRHVPRSGPFLDFEGTFEFEARAGVFYVVTPQFAQSVAGPSVRFHTISLESCGRGSRGASTEAPR